MTDQTKIRNFSIIAHIDRVAPRLHILRLRRLAKAHPFRWGSFPRQSPLRCAFAGPPF